MDLHLPISPASFLPPCLPPSLLSQLVPSLSICLAQGLEVQEKAGMEVCIPKTSQPQGSIRSKCNREMAVMKAGVAGRSPRLREARMRKGIAGGGNSRHRGRIKPAWPANCPQRLFPVSGVGSLASLVGAVRGLVWSPWSGKGWAGVL